MKADDISRRLVLNSHSCSLLSVPHFRFWLVTAAPLAMACHHDASRNSVAVSSAIASATPVPRGQLSAGEIVHRMGLTDRTAFDLVASPEGVTVVAARPAKNGSAMVLIRMDQRGKTLRETSTPVPGAGPVVEIAAAGAGERFAAAWIEKTRDGMEAFASLGSLKDTKLAEPSSLGAASIATSERGQIAVGAAWSPPGMTAPERFIVFHRGATVPCADAPAGCVEFPLHEVEAQSVAPRRVALSVPAPCGRAIAGFSAETTRWYYGVCALENGRAATTMFTIEHSPEYAEAERVLEGCVPIGATVVGGRAILVGRCTGGRHAVRLGGRTAEATTISVGDVEVSCRDEKLALRARGERPLDVVLGEATPDIAPVLPESMAPPDARAVWTGRALFVGAPEGADLVVRRYECGGVGSAAK